MDFEESVKYLLSLGHETLTMKLGLRNTELLLKALGHPEKTFPSVQIAGTNGKGSTAVFLDSICRAAGIRTGLFTSPHLNSITERISINGSEISQDDFARNSTLVRSTAQHLISSGQLPALPTFFEHVTAIALLAFREAEVEIAILETGLGGRLDATTVAGAETVAITALALDHQEYLGETLPEIASEKAAIIRPGVSAVVAPQLPEAMDVILRRCEETEVAPVLVDERGIGIHSSTSDGRFTVTFATSESRYDSVEVGLRGRHQILNAFLALQLAESLRKRGFSIPDRAVVSGLEAARHRGRLELLDQSPPLLLDGAHNPSGAIVLREYLKEFVQGPITLIFGTMKDKRLNEIAAILFSVASLVILTRPDNQRSADVQDLQELARVLLPEERILTSRSASDALAIANKVTPANGLICATGSLYLLGEITCG